MPNAERDAERQLWFLQETCRGPRRSTKGPSFGFEGERMASLRRWHLILGLKVKRGLVLKVEGADPRPKKKPQASPELVNGNGKAQRALGLSWTGF